MVTSFPRHISIRPKLPDWHHYRAKQASGNVPLESGAREDLSNRRYWAHLRSVPVSGFTGPGTATLIAKTLSCSGQIFWISLIKRSSAVSSGSSRSVPLVLERIILLGWILPGEKQAARNCVPPMSIEMYCAM